jgi:TonB family protein
MFDIAGRLKIVGTVAIACEIDETGVAGNFKLLKGLGYGLDEEAAEALKTWRFTPGRKNGNPVVYPTTVEFNFR